MPLAISSSLFEISVKTQTLSPAWPPARNYCEQMEVLRRGPERWTSLARWPGDPWQRGRMSGCGRSPEPASPQRGGECPRRTGRTPCSPESRWLTLTYCCTCTGSNPVNSTEGASSGANFLVGGGMSSILQNKQKQNEGCIVYF